MELQNISFDCLYHFYEITDIPKHPGVYILYDDISGQAFYIGQSKNINRRWKNHELYKKLFGTQQEYMLGIIFKNNQKERIQLEEELISQYNPAFNIKNIKSNKFD